ncbi:hypothetical protein ACFY10_55000, partial [Streptomyces sp. NPDC001401]
MSDLTVNPWKRHGKDRLYVNLSDGTTVAWADRATRVITIKRENYRREAVALLRQHLGDPVTVRSDRPESSAVRDPGPTGRPRQAQPSAAPQRRSLALPELTVADDLEAVVFPDVIVEFPLLRHGSGVVAGEFGRSD